MSEVLQAFQEDSLNLVDGCDMLSRNVGDFQSTLRNLIEERRSKHTRVYIVEYIH